VPFRDVISEDEEDLYPSDSDKHSALLQWCERAFLAAESHQAPYRERWLRFYKLFRNHVVKVEGDMRHKVFFPIPFHNVQTILPRLVAQLPEPMIQPVGEDDVAGAPKMEELLKWSLDQSELYLQHVIAEHSAVVFGTGILKTRPGKRVHHRTVVEDVMQPITARMSQPVPDPDNPGEYMKDLDGAPLFEDQEVTLGEQPTGEKKKRLEEVVSYVGPVAEAVDIFNFFPAPEADSPENARYVIQRRWVDKTYVEEMVTAKIWRLPDQIGVGEGDTSLAEEPVSERLSSIDLGGSQQDDTAGRLELWECWRRTPKGIQVITVLARKAIVRVARNPYEHGEMPYVRYVDYLNPFEFWGTGEVETVEGMTDLLNSLWNQRIDNVRLVLNAMIAVDAEAITDPKELRSRAGGIVRLKNPNGLPLDHVFHRIDIGDVTGSAYSEAAEVERMIEKISGVNGFTAGGDPMENMNQTATGAAIVTEQGNTRFMLKVRLAELTALRRLMRMFGALLQQFTPEGFVMRIIGPDGSASFQQVTSEALYGAFDYDIQTDSSAQTESIRKQQAIELYQMFAADPLMNPRTPREDILRTYGKKNLDEWFAQQAPVTVDQNGNPIEDPNAMAAADQGLTPEMAALAQGGAV
jgi:hypothetical protein